MDTFSPYLFYLLILLVLVGGGVLVEMRGRVTQTIQNALIWGLIFVMLIIGYGFRDVFLAQFDPGRAVVSGDGAIQLERAADGHFYADLTINGTDVTFFVDTGASDLVLSQEDAARVGIDPTKLFFTGRAQTANGIVRTADIRLDLVEFGGQVDQRVAASVTDGEMNGSLLGMSYLEKFEVIEIRGNRMRLVR